MNILCITHADFESPGVIEDWAAECGHSFVICKPYKGEILPDVNDVDFLIVMGGPQSPLKLNSFPYLSTEIQYIQKALSKNIRILGFCLGAQLIGEALGASTEHSPKKEVGVYPISLTQEGQEDPLLNHLPESVAAIHWHTDMPGLTSESQVLAYSKGCPRQIIKYRKNVYGFQCHLEITKEGIETMILAVPEDLEPSAYTQSRDELLKNDYRPIHKMIFQILDKYVEI